MKNYVIASDPINQTFDGVEDSMRVKQWNRVLETELETLAQMQLIQREMIYDDSNFLFHEIEHRKRFVEVIKQRITALQLE